MKRYYVTKKGVNTFIENSLKRFDSLETFRNELVLTIEDLTVGNNPNQVRFYKKVLKELN